MPHYQFLVVGGGMAAAAAIDGIRQVIPDASIGLIGAEPDPPYDRPPLSKGLWKGRPLEKIWRKIDGPGVVPHLGRRAERLEPSLHRLTDDHGTVYTFDRCLLATGGTPRRLPTATDDVIYFRTLEDYRRLRALADQRQRFAVIGGGFIGSEIAAALAMNGKEVTMVIASDGISAHLFPANLAHFLVEFYREKGVRVLTRASVTAVTARGTEQVVQIRAANQAIPSEVVVDGVVAGIGIEPNLELARAAGLAVDGGIVVDATTRTSHPDVYAAGDVAAFYNPALGKRLRVEHEDNANTMGAHAGRAMAGQAAPYTHLPFFYSDLFELGYEAVGELDSRLETVEDWKEPYREGVVYYLGDGRVRGVLLWNTWDQIDAARRLIAAPGPVRPADLIGRLPE